jgi:hypothetical protein
MIHKLFEMGLPPGADLADPIGEQLQEAVETRNFS